MTGLFPGSNPNGESEASLENKETARNNRMRLTAPEPSPINTQQITSPIPEPVQQAPVQILPKSESIYDQRNPAIYNDTEEFLEKRNRLRL